MIGDLIESLLAFFKRQASQETDFESFIDGSVRVLGNDENASISAKSENGPEMFFLNTDHIVKICATVQVCSLFS